MQTKSLYLNPATLSKSSSWTAAHFIAASGQAAGKANASDLSIELSYAVRGDTAYVNTVKIDGVEYRSDCSGTGEPEVEDETESELPHCKDVQNPIRDVNCYGSTEPPPVTATEPRIPIDSNLRERFRTAEVIEVPEPGRTEEGGLNAFWSPTYILEPPKDHFFRMELLQGVSYVIGTAGETDTYGELFHDDNGQIRFIMGTGEFADRRNFALHADNVAGGTYYVRVSGEDGEEGTYLLYVIPGYDQ